MGQFARGQKVGEAIVITKNQPGSLSKIIAILEDLGLNVFRVYGGASESYSISAVFLIFFEAKDKQISLNRVKKHLSSIEDVKKVIVRGFSDFLIDTSAVPLLEAGSPAILLRCKTLASLEEGMKYIEERKKDSASVLIWSGWEAGRHDIKWLKDLASNATPDTILNLALKIKQSAGWGIFSVELFNVNKFYGKIVVYNSIETVGRTELSKEPLCHLMRGYIAGVVGEIFQKPIEVTETKCKAQGAKKCEFEFGK